MVPQRLLMMIINSLSQNLTKKLAENPRFQQMVHKTNEEIEKRAKDFFEGKMNNTTTNSAQQHTQHHASHQYNQQHRAPNVFDKAGRMFSLFGEELKHAVRELNPFAKRR
jgi:hypothetical protein